MPKIIPSAERPLIGITTGAKPNWLAYLAIKYGVMLAGGRSVRISPEHNIDYVRELNGLVLSGGSDIDPSLYGHPNIASYNVDENRDKLEAECAEMAYLERLPVLGICRGSQMLSIVKGGTLHQDAPSIFDGFLPTESTLGKICVRRKVQIKENSRLIEILEDNPELWVNSLHHQAQDKLGEGLKAVACDDQGIVQAVEATTAEHFVLGVQWHPEFMLYSSPQRRIFKTLVRAARTSMKAVKEQATNKNKETFATARTTA